MSPGLKAKVPAVSAQAPRHSTPDPEKGMDPHCSASASVELNNRLLPASASPTVHCSHSRDGPRQVPHCSQPNWHKSLLSVIQTAQFKEVAHSDDSSVTEP